MARILTGIQSSGKPHLGNLLGAMLPAINLSKKEKDESLLFIADMHSFITIKNPKLRKKNTQSIAAAWLACNLDTNKTIFYRQSKVPQVTELAWYLNCITPFPMLANSHSFKDKSDKLSDVNAGLFIYPTLMASDILLYDANIIPIGKDQKQHLEMTRDIARSFNHQFGETFIIPEARIDKNIMLISGTDGQKMSKSYGNIIDIFLPQKQLKKNIDNIITDSTPLEKPKNYDTCNVFNIYKTVADENQITDMKKKYEGGNYGYGHAKIELFNLLINKFFEERKLYDYYMSNESELEFKLQKGEEKARDISNTVLQRVRNTVGY